MKKMLGFDVQHQEEASVTRRTCKIQERSRDLISDETSRHKESDCPIVAEFAFEIGSKGSLSHIWNIFSTHPLCLKHTVMPKENTGTEHTHRHTHRNTHILEILYLIKKKSYTDC
jgi:hypothetical protein